MRTKKIIEEDGSFAYPLIADISNWSSCKNASQQIIKKFNKIDFLINNASGWSSKTLDDIKIDEIEDLISTTVKGTLFITKAFLPYFKEQRFGHIINIISLEAWPLASNNNKRTPFASSKYAILGFSEILRRELKEFNIKVSSIFPDSTSSNLNAKGQFDSDYPHVGYKEASAKDKLIVKDIVSSVVFTLCLSSNAVVENIVISSIAKN